MTDRRTHWSDGTPIRQRRRTEHCAFPLTCRTCTPRKPSPPIAAMPDLGAELRWQRVLEYDEIGGVEPGRYDIVDGECE